MTAPLGKNGNSETKHTTGISLSNLPDTILQCNEMGVLLDYYSPPEFPYFKMSPKHIKQTIEQFFPADLSVIIIKTARLVFEQSKNQTFFYTPPEDKNLHFEIRIVSQNDENFLILIRVLEEFKDSPAELIKQRDDAINANKSKSEFLANMIHELRTPLSGLLGYTRVLQEESLSPTQQEHVSIIERSGNHLMNLVNDTLDLARMEANKMELKKSLVQLPNMLDGIASIIRIKAKENALEFKFRKDLNLPQMVRTDEKRLSQVLINLLGNAIKFTDKGEVLFTISKTKTNVRFEVKDTGPGIPDEKLKDIFQPFKQLSQEKRNVEGAGLGLAISKEIINLLGGQLNVESSVGYGSTFWFELDLPDQESENTQIDFKKKRIIGHDGKQRRVLVVDDLSINRTIITKLLKNAGFDVKEADSGIKALEIVSSFEPELICMDLKMPEMDGFETTRRIRERYSKDEIKIIAITASAFTETREKSLEVGCNDFLPKPVTPENLFEVIQKNLKLTYIYGEKKQREKQADKTAVQKKSIVPPAPEIIKEYYDLAVRGDIQAIIRKLESSPDAQKDHQSFFEKIRILAGAFQIKQIREFLKQYTEENV